MSARSQVTLASLLAACLLAAVVALAGATGPTATERLGDHYEEAGFTGLLARPDGSVLAVRDKHIESFDVDGKAEGEIAPVPRPYGAKLYPAAAEKTFVLDGRSLTRLDSDDRIDKSFGGDGKVYARSPLEAVAELGSGEIALISAEAIGPKTTFSELKVELRNQDGSLDKGAGFMAPLAVGPGIPTPIAVPEIVPTPDGGILAIGEYFLLKLNADGSPDAGFGDGGIVNGPETVDTIGGRLLADGSVETVSSGQVLRRYTPSGVPDSSFGPEGARTLKLLDHRVKLNVASIGADGSVIAAGRAATHGSCPRAECEEGSMVAAWNAAGERETAFGEGGVLKPASLAGLDHEYSFDGVTAIVRRSDGSIVVAGNAPPKNTTGFLAALSPQGALLPGFGVDGVVRASEAKPASLKLAGLLPLPRGKVLGLGATDLGIDEAPVLVRYTAANRLDRTFGGGDGYVVLGKAQGLALSGPRGFAASGGKILTSAIDFPRDLLLMVHAKSGSPVASFGAGGFIDLPGRVDARDLAFDPGGRPVVVGRRRYSETPAPEPGVVLRYLPDGRPDPSFRNGNGFTMELGGEAVRGKAVLAGPGRRILAGGSFGKRFAIVSLLPDGRPDPHFGRHGWAVIDAGLRTGYMTLGRDGAHIYLAGAAAGHSGHREVMLARFDRRGHLDKTFGRHGLLEAPLQSPTQPIQIVPVGRSVLLVLSEGSRPLLTVTARGRIRRPPLGGKPHYLGDVRAGIGDGALAIAWNDFVGEGLAYGHLARRPLPGS